MEIEALIAIFMDDFKIITDKPPRSYELSVWPSSDRFVIKIMIAFAICLSRPSPPNLNCTLLSR
jgi:hypothetical protein